MIIAIIIMTINDNNDNDNGVSYKIKNSIMWFNSMLYNTIKHTIQYIQCNAMQYSTV